MNRITFNGVKSLNKKINENFPDQGEFAITNEDNIKSALSVFDSYYDYEEQIAAALFRSLIAAHGFENANKRTAFCAIVACKVPTNLSPDELRKLAVNLANSGKIDVDELATLLYGDTRTPVGDYDFEIAEAVEKHDELNQKIFNGDELDQKVKDKLLEIVDVFKGSLEQDEVKLDVKDVVIVGSSVSYNYTSDSDIDLHIVADLSAYPNQEELAEKLYNAYKSLFNNKYDPTIYNIPVEVYVEPEGMKANSKGRYSLYNGWEQKPEKEEIPEAPDIKADYAEWESKAKACDTAEEIDAFMDDVYKLRQNGLLADGEFSKENLIFKELRNNNVLQDLKDKKVEIENKEMSLEENINDENINEIDKPDESDDFYDHSTLEEASEEDIRAKALADYLDISVEAIDESGDNEYDTPEGDFLVLSDSEADQYAKDSITQLFDELGFEAFTKDFTEYVIDYCINPAVVDDFINDELDYFEAQEEDQEMTAYLQSLDDDADKLDYIREQLGDEQFAKWLVENSGIDVDALADEALDQDGRGHFIATYDGDELELNNNLFAYRIN